MVLPGKAPEWHVILTALLKLGAIAIPCAPQLRVGDRQFGAEHSGSVVMISGPEGEGYLWFVGLSDDVILSAGYRIGLFEVESVLIDQPAIVESALVPTPDGERGGVVRAYVVVGKGHESSNVLAQEIQDYCKAHTAPYKYPHLIEFIADLPKTTSGKSRRVELRQRESASA